jgi:hypothetical protein
MVGDRTRPSISDLSLGGTIACRGSFLFGAPRKDARLMPRYFFILAYPDLETSDPSAVMAPSDDAAITAARNVIDALRAELGPEEPNPTMIVKNEAGEIIYRYPSN